MRHNCKPRDERISNEYQRILIQQPGSVEDVPQGSSAAEPLRPYSIENVVKRNRRKCDCKNDFLRQIYESGKDDHRQSERPDHEQELRESPAEHPPEMCDGHFEKDQPETSRPEKAAYLTFGFSAR